MSLVHRAYYGPNSIGRRMFDHYHHFPLLKCYAPHLSWAQRVAPNSWLDAVLAVRLLPSYILHSILTTLIAEESPWGVEGWDVRRSRMELTRPRTR